MEINVNRLIAEFEPSELSGSIAERGANAAKETWANSVKAAEKPLLKPEERDGFRAYVKEFGAWDADEIAAWSNTELDALLLQYAAGDLREAQGCVPGDGIGGIDWDEFEIQSHEGTLSGNLFVHEGELYIQLG